MLGEEALPVSKGLEQPRLLLLPRLPRRYDSGGWTSEAEEVRVEVANDDVGPWLGDVERLAVEAEDPRPLVFHEELDVPGVDNGVGDAVPALELGDVGKRLRERSALLRSLAGVREKTRRTMTAGPMRAACLE